MAKHSKPKARKRGVASTSALILSTSPMEARLAAHLPKEGGWQFEPKWDGFRCLAFRMGMRVELRAKSGKSLSRYFPEVVAALRAVRVKRFVVDGELVVPIGSVLSFDSLQQRLHPAASRVQRLARETPATFVLFDCLMSADGAILLDAPLRTRRAALELLVRSFGAQQRLRLSPYTRDRRTAERWLAGAGGALDGVVAKQVNGAYVPGIRAMIKIKKLRSADCVVGGFRYGTHSRQVGSLLLGLYDSQGRLNHVGFTSSISQADRAQLTRKLESRIAPPGFTGRAPGAPSRWSQGCRYAMISWLRCVSTTSRMSGSGTGRDSCAGVRTRGRFSALLNN